MEHIFYLFLRPLYFVLTPCKSRELHSKKNNLFQIRTL